MVHGVTDSDAGGHAVPDDAAGRGGQERQQRAVEVEVALGADDRGGEAASASQAACASAIRSVSIRPATSAAATSAAIRSASRRPTALSGTTTSPGLVQSRPADPVTAPAIAAAQPGSAAAPGSTNTGLSDPISA